MRLVLRTEGPPAETLRRAGRPALLRALAAALAVPPRSVALSSIRTRFDAGGGGEGDGGGGDGEEDGRRAWGGGATALVEADVVGVSREEARDLVEIVAKVRESEGGGERDF